MLNLPQLIQDLKSYDGPHASQLGQDVLAWTINDRKENGYFVEFGALDGGTDSNTLILERLHGWQGILAEPGKIFHDALSKNRTCHIDHRAVTNRTGDKLMFKETNVQLGFSGLVDYFHPADMHARARRDSQGEVYEVETVSLNDLLDHYNAPSRIDYLSADTEGSEYLILSNLDFNKYSANLITVEHNCVEENRERLRSLLEGHGYRRILMQSNCIDDWYVHHDIWNRA